MERSYPTVKDRQLNKTTEISHIVITVSMAVPSGSRIPSANHAVYSPKLSGLTCGSHRPLRTAGDCLATAMSRPIW